MKRLQQALLAQRGQVVQQMKEVKEAQSAVKQYKDETLKIKGRLMDAASKLTKLSEEKEQLLKVQEELCRRVKELETELNDLKQPTATALSNHPATDSENRDAIAELMGAHAWASREMISQGARADPEIGELLRETDQMLQMLQSRGQQP